MALEDQVQCLLAQPDFRRKIEAGLEMEGGGSFLAIEHEGQAYLGRLAPEGADDMGRYPEMVPRTLAAIKNLPAGPGVDWSNVDEYVSARVADYIANYEEVGGNLSLAAASRVYLVKSKQNLHDAETLRLLVRSLDSPIHPNNLLLLPVGMTFFELNELTKTYFPTTLLNLELVRPTTWHVLALDQKQRGMKRTKIRTAARSQLARAFPHSDPEGQKLEINRQYCDLYQGWFNTESGALQLGKV